MRRFIFVVFLSLLFVGVLSGRTVKRVVSLAPSLTEMVYALGAQDKLVGVTRYCNYPYEVTNLTRVGGMLDVNIETLIRLKPDVILLSYSGNTAQQAEQFQKLGFRTETFRENSVMDILSNIIRISGVLGVSPVQATNLFLTQYHAIVPVQPQKTVIFLLSWKPAYSVTAQTFIGDALQLAGLSNVVSSPLAYPSLSIEDLVRLNPRYWIAVQTLQTEQKSMNRILGKFGIKPRWIFVDADTLSRPGPRVVGAIQDLIKKLR